MCSTITKCNGVVAFHMGTDLQPTIVYCNILLSLVSSIKSIFSRHNIEDKVAGKKEALSEISLFLQYMRDRYS